MENNNEFEKNMSFLLGEKIEKSVGIDELSEFLIKGDDKQEVKSKVVKNTHEKSGLVPKGTVVFHSKKNKKFIMTKDHHTNFEHDVDKMLVFDWHDESYFVKKTDVTDYEDGSIMKPEKIDKKQSKTNIEKSLNQKGLINLEVKNDYKYVKKIEDGLGYKRDQMPQVDSKYIDKLLVHFGDKVKIKTMKKLVSKIKFAQGEINEDKVLKILSSKGKLKKQGKRIFILSSDGYLLDGHHGVSAMLEEKIDRLVNVKRISLPFKNLKKRVNQMKISKKESL